MTTKLLAVSGFVCSDRGVRTGNGRYETHGESSYAIDLDTCAESFGGSAGAGFSGRWVESGRQGESHDQRRGS